MTCLSSILAHCVCIVVEGGEVEAQLRLQDQTIYRLKQEVASLKEEKEPTTFMNKELMSEIQELRRQLSSAPIKEESTANGTYLCGHLLTYVNQ